MGVYGGVGSAVPELERFKALGPSAWRGVEVLRACGLTRTGMRDGLVEVGGVTSLLRRERVEYWDLGVNAKRDLRELGVAVEVVETGVGGSSRVLANDVPCVRLGIEVKLVAVDSCIVGSVVGLASSLTLLSSSNT